MAKRAAALAKLDRLAAGSKSVFDADMNDIGALGIGMQLYFMLTKYLSITFLCMGVIALPTIVVNYFGNGVTDKLVDPLQLAYASLGNQGVSPDIASDPKLCLPKGDIDCTWKTVNTPFTSNPETVSWLITIADCIYSTGFLLFCLVYRYHAKKAIELHSTENLTPAKYAVYVRGFPPDAKEQEILDHFNALYDPTKEDEYFPLWLSCCWGKRRKVNKALAAATKNQKAANMCVVTNVDHLAATTATNKEIYLNTWIAEVSIGHPTGGLLRTFLSMEALTRSIAETQELIQILEQEKVAAAAGAVITPMATKGGKASTKPPKKVTFKAGDQKLLTQAKEKLEKLNAAMEKKTSKIKAFKQTNATLGSPSKATAAVDPMQDGEVKVKSNAASAKRLAKAARKAATATEKAFNWDACQCAFVVFNNLESKRRCLRDYRKSTWWLPHKYQPKLLRFRSGQHRLIVEQAPEPSNILWENLEITDRGRLYRRSFTNFVTFLLLLFSCAIISGAQSAQQTFKSKMPPAGLCEWSLPQVFYGSDSFDANSKLAWDLQWDQNATCDPGTNNETRYHIAYTNGIVNAFNFTNPAVVAAGAASPVRCVDPCVSDSSATTCSTLPCFNQDLVDEGDVCETYLASHILYCLCTDALTTSMDDFGFIDGPKMLWETYTPCRGFITDYLTKNAFIVVAAGIVVIVNLLLKAILRAFANFERHSSESAKASAIAIKMFSAQFLNTAIIVLVVNATLGLNKIPLAKELFNGKYRDFEREWYPTVGMGITMTMLINAFVPQLLLFVQMFVLAPIRRCLTRRKIRTQHQMNQLYAGPQFDIAVRYPMILNSVFVTMVFCGGSPVLLFIASIAAAGTFWLDKLSLLHMYSIKTTYDEELGEIALQILPWTLVLHLGFSTWMYGNTTLMKSATIDLTALLQFFGYKATSASSDPNAVYQEFLDKATKIDILGENGFVVKVVHSNVMTVFVFFLIVLVGIFLSTLWLQVLLPILKRTLFLILQAIWKRLKPRLARATARLAWKRKKKVEKLQKSAKVAVDLPTPAEVAEAPALLKCLRHQRHPQGQIHQ
uniref:CSC1/OSCA1-like 7TM region domain-containing protein n=1 Tax=Globisporangium ultimum (strain ATCC 200006 / CBS 805.95 / DAOM BR144) TaxID=431595 RepID=K3X9A9_GLOUD